MDVHTVFPEIQHPLVEHFNILRVATEGNAIACHCIPGSHREQSTVLILCYKEIQDCAIIYKCIQLPVRK